MEKIFSILKETAFAPAERKDEMEVICQSAGLKKELKKCAVLDMMPDLIVILNPERQVIFANQAIINFLKKDDDSSLLGLRPGEMLDCVHAQNNSGGCGTTKYCRECGAVNSILKVQKCHLSDQRECDITTSSDKAYNLRIWSFPFERNNCQYTLLVIRDIADEIYRNSLERIFFHDIINIGSGLFGLLNMIDGDPKIYEEHHQLLVGLAQELLEEINAQRDLLQAERGTVAIHWLTVSSFEIICLTAQMLEKHQVAAGKNIIIDQASEDVSFKTDSRILKRIIINMVKNALEAAKPGENIVLKTQRRSDKVVFEVHNGAFIPEEVQLNIFKRSFSTKGKGRGLGTYSLKLLSEIYLQGRVYFESSPEKGTSFFAEYPIKPKLDDNELS